MSRTIKRVPLDFAHEGTWPGYLAEDRCDPPEGEGWQCWEDVTEGSPISPVFADRAELVAWISKHENCAPEAAEAFVRDGWAPSFLGTPFGFFRGVEIAAGVETAIEWLYVKDGDTSSIPSQTKVRHLETGITGVIAHRMPPDHREFYLVTWDRGLPTLLAEDPELDPDKSMQAFCRTDGFEVLNP